VSSILNAKVGDILVEERVIFKFATSEALFVNEDQPLVGKDEQSLISWYASSICSPGAMTCAKSPFIFEASISEALPSNPSSKLIYPPSIK
jgi:hypothetical protein